MSVTRELEIIHQGAESYQFSSNYDGIRYYILINYNSRNDTWYLDVRDANLETLVSGLPCLTNVSGMTFRFKLSNVFPVGDLITADSNGTGLDPTLDNFGDNVSTFYLSILDEL